MSGLHFLRSNDFNIQQGTNGKILTTNISGFSLVLFYSTQCVHCQNFIPVFKKLPSSIGGCQFAMINVSQNRDCVTMSRETITPITEVPYILLYIDGKPYMRYKGPHEMSKISTFIMEVVKNIQENKGNAVPASGTSQKKIPEYTIGQPLCGPDDKVCYLEFDVAYDKKKQSVKAQPGVGLPQQAGMVATGR